MTCKAEISLASGLQPEFLEFAKILVLTSLLLFLQFLRKTLVFLCLEVKTNFNFCAQVVCLCIFQIHNYLHDNIIALILTSS